MLEFLKQKTYVEAKEFVFMEQFTVGSVLNIFKDLPFTDKEYAFEILQKQMIEEKRRLLALRINEARTNIKTGKVKKGSVKELLKDLAGA